MRAREILRAELRDGAEIVHAKQWSALWRAVTGLLDQGQLWLTALGRALPGNTSDKHRIKAADRLLGSTAIQLALPAIYAVLARFLLRRLRRPLIVVDWTGGGSSAFYILTAALCFQGRALAIYSRTFPVKRKCSPKAEREFLMELAKLMPRHCSPILVTDAGFQSNWFDAVRKIGWDFVGRLRGKKMVSLGEDWIKLEEVHALAGKKAKDLGVCRLRKKGTRMHRLVLSKRRKLKGRHRLSTLGTKRQRTADRQRSTAAREPLLLVTSLHERAADIVSIYDVRMQIEQTFRDLKSHRYGWSLEDVRCRSTSRVDVLLMIAALAAVVLHLVGLAARWRKLDHALQANTERRRPVFSTFFLGRLVVRRGLHNTIPSALLRQALTSMRHLIAQPAPT
jgi:hypothetical protein